MLRALQTNALSDKVDKLFETLTPKANFQASPVLVEVKDASNDRQALNDAPLMLARSRRSRRARPGLATSNIRSSWF